MPPYLLPNPRSLYSLLSHVTLCMPFPFAQILALSTLLLTEREKEREKSERGARVAKREERKRDLLTDGTRTPGQTIPTRGRERQASSIHTDAATPAGDAGGRYNISDRQPTHTQLMCIQFDNTSEISVSWGVQIRQVFSLVLQKGIIILGDQGCFKGSSRSLQRGFSGDSRGLQKGCFKGPSRGLQGGFPGALYRISLF